MSGERLSRWTVAALLACALGCGKPDVPRARDVRQPGGLSDPATGARVGAAAHGAAAPPARAAAEGKLAATLPDARPLVLFLGDSLTAGHGLAAEEAFPEEVEQLLAREGAPIRALNAGVSGDTTAGGLERVDRLLAQKPAIVVVELGANDGMRGQPIDDIEANLREIVGRAQAAGARVVVAGMKIPPNYGPEYAEQFASIYPAVAESTGATLIPFLLVDVAGRPELNQADGIHPTAEGQQRVARTVAEILRPVVKGLGARRARR